MNTYSFGNCITECCTPVMGVAMSEIVGPDNVLTVNFTACEPATDFRIFYRPQGSIIAYRDGGTVTTSPFVVTDSLDTAGTQYEGYIQSECGGGLLGDPVAFVTSGFGCGDGINDSYAGFEYHLYTTYFLTATGTVHINYDVFERPNRFTVYDITTAAQVVTSGWVGDANYPGPWGLSLFTPSTGTITFVTVTGHSYKLIVEAGGADPTNQLSDSFDILITCD